MKGDFCRMCGSKKLRREERNIFLEKRKKPLRPLAFGSVKIAMKNFLMMRRERNCTKQHE